jgi:hypothetical protein
MCESRHQHRPPRNHRRRCVWREGIELTAAHNLSSAERKAATATARKALDDAGLQDAPLLVGTGGGSVQTTLELTREAAEAGASHAIVILPGAPERLL